VLPPQLVHLAFRPEVPQHTTIERLALGNPAEFGQTLLDVLCEMYQQIFHHYIDKPEATRQEFESTNSNAFKTIESLLGISEPTT
jgi:hypothetical protein